MWIIGDAYFSSVWESGSRFINDGRDKILFDFTSFFWLNLPTEGARTPKTCSIGCGASGHGTPL